MASLTGTKIQDTYVSLLKTHDNVALSSSYKQITDGGGNNTQIYLSTSRIKFHDAYAFPIVDGQQYDMLTTDGAGDLNWTFPQLSVGSDIGYSGALDVKGFPNLSIGGTTNEITTSHVNSGSSGASTVEAR